MCAGAGLRSGRRPGAPWEGRRHAALALAPWLVLAHPIRPTGVGELARAWTWEPGVVVPLALSAWLYFFGLRRLWRESATGRGVGAWEAAAFAAGWYSLFLALVSPLHALGGALFSAHMVQHEVLMLVAAPLLVLGRPMLPFLWALPIAWRRRAGALGKTRWWQAVWRSITNPLVAWAIHAAALWVWHAPALFQATIDSDLVHTLQHASFFGSALLFWWAVFHGRRGSMGYGVAVLYVFTTSLHSGALGALITCASHVLYPIYATTTEAWGLTPLEDQQLGGLIMWVPAAVVYLAAGLALFAGWLRESDRRVERRERQFRLEQEGTNA